MPISGMPSKLEPISSARSDSASPRVWKGSFHVPFIVADSLTPLGSTLAAPMNTRGLSSSVTATAPEISM
jgi:hypothetical protein